MALIKCSECGNEVSDKAKNCPKCGAKVKVPMGKKHWIAIGVAALSVTYCMSVSNKYPSAPPDPMKDVRLDKTRSAVDALKESLRDSESLRINKVFSNADGSVVCIDYAARNGFGGMNKDFVTYLNGVPKVGTQAWNKNCVSSMFDQTGYSNFIK